MTDNDVSRIIQAIDEGDSFSSEDLLPAVYSELRELAARRMARELPGQTLQPTALVHEAYLRLLGNQEPRWKGRAHFFGAAALAMRRILVERARRVGRIRHGGDRQRVDVEPDALPHEELDIDYVALDEALRRMEGEDPTMHQVVMLRFFAGLGVQETAHVMGISARTVKREWATARTVLYLELGSSEEPAEPGP